MKTLNYFKALSDETRLRLLNLLIHHELNVNEIVTTMDMGQSRISRHLKILTDCGLLTSRRDGLWIFYRSSENGHGREFIDFFAAVLKRDRELEEDLSKFETILENKSNENTEFFNSIAPGLNKIKSEIFGKLNINEEIIQRVALRGKEVAADLGCGNGELLQLLRNKAENVIGVDKSPKMLDEAMLALSNKNGSVDLRIGAIEHLPMRDGEADIAIINMVLHYLPSPLQGITEANRALKKGSQLIVVDLDKHNHEELRTKYEHRWLGFSEKEMEKLLRKAGFDCTEKVNFSVEHGLRVNLFSAVKK